MKDYPSIARSTGTAFEEFHGHLFAKPDGSNLRWEWNRKKGWYKSGSRTVLFDKTHPFLGGAPDIFQRDLAEKLTKMSRDERWDSVTTFTEFHGAQSLGGWHAPDDVDPKKLTLFDIAPYKKGILGPREYLKLISKYQLEEQAVPYLGQVHWTRGFVERVWRGEVEGASFEGVVGKAGEGHHVIRAKAKTKLWVDAILARYGSEQGQKIIDS